ncbi:bifunctional hydroxymethylpyrimidine kinase/phosphomethylpyrimidine kinase [Corynebacterium gerontici]|uniref:Thiamine biosynthesis multifunctional protein ThiED n=1 Tax=Corynebacterium gerontici TaxID=2079234 RepID=A0A3G6J1Y7_9CORY|nr:bifunctional hydroxymethylpyrimidine kinase/phosphomethylpyrimidine kinase [Corynebacterium gerontici]AZA10390.1 Hydroxymethylpyrimidine/phosphomethylpyrimidine kinase [Corynebacterium gerontici]
MCASAPLSHAPSRPRVLSIAGTDPTGGAGAQADIKAISAAGGYALSAITAIVSQNTQGVREVFTPPTSVLASQLNSISEDVAIDAIKIGMLGQSATVKCVCDWLTRQLPNNVVIDPVMVATSGHRLLDNEAEHALRELLPLATLITPNIPELAVLAGGEPATSLEAAIEQAQELQQHCDTAVLVKGGHLGCKPLNALVSAQSVAIIDNERVHTLNTHGTGCSLSSAIATRLGAGDDLLRACTWATRWLHGALVHADALHVGKGNGPVDHFYYLEPPVFD